MSVPSVENILTTSRSGTTSGRSHGPRRNILFLMSDQHAPRASGHRGHPDVLTPNLDRLAALGTVFRSAYCTSPICVPARASIATGRYVHELENWDNAAPYVGGVPSWGHMLTASGHSVTTIGKLHFRSDEDDTGYPDQRIPMHVHRGGDLRGVALRSQGRLPDPGSGIRNILDAGRGTSDYTAYDGQVATLAEDFLREEITGSDQPWALMVSFVSPHFPLIAPDEFFDLYDDDSLTLPFGRDEAWDHPSVDVYRTSYGFDRPFTESETRRALRAYLALCTFMDHQIGRVLDALVASGQWDDTLIVYTSDHGESAGAHGLWFKHLMNDESVGVPFIMVGEGVAAGAVVDAPVSHVDVTPTLLAWVGAEDQSPTDLPGRSLLDVSRLDAGRPVFSEYHANWSVDGTFMLRDGRYKYIEHIGASPQLFDVLADPAECNDLARDAANAGLLTEYRARIREHFDPDEVDARAKADQDRRVAAVGGIDEALARTVNFTPTP